MSRTVNPRYRILLGLFIAFIHMFFLLYLHFAYHALAESMFRKIIFYPYIYISIFLAVAHALNNEPIVTSDLAVKPIPPVVSEVTQAKGNYSLLKYILNYDDIFKVLLRRIRNSFANSSNITTTTVIKS